MRIDDVEAPAVGDRQVRIALQTAAVNPVDIATRTGALHASGLHDGVPVRLGWDLCGQVEEVGAGVCRRRVGQSVITLSDRLWAASKGQSEMAVLDEDAVAAGPAGLDPGGAACLPLVGTTAAQALRALRLLPGQSAMITGAAGAVSMAVQLARRGGL